MSAVVEQGAVEQIEGADTGAPLVLVTGLPGAGKTLYALAKFAVGKRDVWQCNIPECALPTFEPTKWPELLPTLPQDATLIFDESREIFPPLNATKELPDYYSFHRIRHTGRRIVLICQHPGDIDARVRRLVGRHLHVVEGFGGGHSVVYEFRGVGDTETRARAIVSKFTHPKSVFGLYKSAEKHHAPRKKPLRLRLVKWVLLFVVLGLVFGGFAAYRALSRLAHPEAVAKGVQAPGLLGPSAGPAEAGRVGSGKVMTQADYVKSFLPRVQHLAYTAPRYDDITKPVRAPVPAACIQSRTKGCKCYSQQATVLNVGDELCTAIVRDGRFQDFNPEGDHAREDNPAPVPVAGAAGLPAAQRVAVAAAPDGLPVAASDPGDAPVAPTRLSRLDRSLTYMPPPIPPSQRIRH